MTIENIYSAPQSDVTAVVDRTNEIEIFPRISAWKVFFLSVFTLGFYATYWLYSRTKLGNRLPNRTLSMMPATILLVLTVVNIPFSILGSVYKEIAIIHTTGTVISVLDTLFTLIVAFTLRRELRTTLELSGASNPTIGPVKTFFFNAIYLQFAINQCIDERNNVSVADREKIF